MQQYRSIGMVVYSYQSLLMEDIRWFPKLILLCYNAVVSSSDENGYCCVSIMCSIWAAGAMLDRLPGQSWLLPVETARIMKEAVILGRQ